jgi:queuine tRNA-ribosyltransferase
LQYYQDLMAGIRGAIQSNCFDKFENNFNTNRAQGDIEPI